MRLSDDGLGRLRRRWRARRWSRTGGRLPTREEALRLIRLADEREALRRSYASLARELRPFGPAASEAGREGAAAAAEGWRRRFEEAAVRDDDATVGDVADLIDMHLRDAGHVGAAARRVSRAIDEHRVVVMRSPRDM